MQQKRRSVKSRPMNTDGKLYREMCDLLARPHISDMSRDKSSRIRMNLERG